MEVTNLTRDSVSILHIIDGENYRKAYENSSSGRAELAADCPPEIVAEVMAVWGDAPTVSENPLALARVPEAWWPDCYITEDDQIFTPRFDDGAMILTGEEVYREWLANKDKPPAPPEPDPQAILGTQVAGLTLSNSMHEDMISVLGAQVAQLALQTAAQTGGENV